MASVTTSARRTHRHLPALSLVLDGDAQRHLEWCVAVEVARGVAHELDAAGAGIADDHAHAADTATSSGVPIGENRARDRPRRSTGRRTRGMAAQTILA